MDNLQFSRAAVGFSALSWGKQIGILVGLALSIAVGFFIVLWSKAPDLAPLYAQLDPKDAMVVMEHLQKLGIDHRFEPAQGGVLIPLDKVNEVRMRLASLGIPKSTEVGFELLEQGNRFSSSQMLDAVRYKRGLEGELAKSIGSLEAVRNARVHLGMPRESTFLKASQASRASVLLDLYPGRQLDGDQVLGIVHLVASSLPGLNKEAVTIIDQTGRLLNQGTGALGQMAMASDQLNYTRQLESSYSKRIQELLIPLLGPNSVRAETTVDMDFTVSEEAEEKYNPQHSAIKNEMLLDEKRGRGLLSEGIPGALSNQPPQPGTSASAPSQGAANSGVGLNEAGSKTVNLEQGIESWRSQVNKHYEVNKAITHVKQGVGKLLRLTVAVLVDDKITYDNQGKETRTKLTEEELKNIRELVQSAVGYNKNRGDIISVLNSSFAQAPPVLEPKEIKFWQQSWFLPFAKQMLGGLLVLLVVFLVLRPLMKNLSAQVISQAAPLPLLQEPLGSASELQTQQQTSRQLSAVSSAQASQKTLERVKEMTQSDPKKVANVVMNWLGHGEE